MAYDPLHPPVTVSADGADGGSDLDIKNPAYCLHEEEWRKSRDVYAGQDRLKEVDGGKCYLPPTTGMLIRWQKDGAKRYTQYKLRACIDHNFQDGVKAYMGLLWSKPPKYENIPKPLEYLLKKATKVGKGKSLMALHREVNLEQVKVGRVGLFGDLPSKAIEGALPYICLYRAEHITNWGCDEDTGALQMVVLDETKPRQKGFNWEIEKRHRVLMLSNGTYRGGVFTGNDGFDAEKLVTPNIAQRALDQIPFVFCNADDVSPEPQQPPMYRLVLKELGQFLAEADLRQALHVQAQETLVVTGKMKKGEDVELGPGACLNVPIGGDGKFIGPESKGLPEQRVVLENDRASARVLAGQLIDTRTREKESGEALKIKLGAQTVTLKEVADSGAEAVQQMLQILAQWVGCSQAEIDKIKVTPNVDFTTAQMDGQTVLALAKGKNEGAPLCRRSKHKLYSFQGLTDLTYEEELAQCKADDADPIGFNALKAKQDAELAEKQLASTEKQAALGAETTLKVAEKRGAQAKKSSKAGGGAGGSSSGGAGGAAA